MKNLKYIITLLLLLVSVNVAQSKRIKFTLQWTAQSQFVGYYVAQELGYYKNLGLDVEINHVSTSTGINNHLNDCDALTLKLYDAISLISNGLDVVNILQTSQHSSLVVVARHNDIKSLSDLKGRKVGIWSASFRELAEGISQDKGLDIEWVPFVQNINLFISGAIDATFAARYGEEYQLRMSGFENNPYIYLSDAGYDFPEDGLYIKADFYKKYPNQAKAFAVASRMGWEWAQQHPDKALEIVIKVMEREHIPVSRRYQKWMLEQILKLQCDKKTNKPSFDIDIQKFNQINQFLIKRGAINKPLSIDKIKGTHLCK